MSGSYEVESFDDVNRLTDYISIITDSKSGGYDTQSGCEGILLSKSYHRDYWGKISGNRFDITVAAYDAFSDTCYGPVEYRNIEAGSGYKSHVTVQVLDKTNPEVKEKFNKVSAWIASQE